MARPQPQRSLRFHISQTGQRIGAGRQFSLKLRLRLAASESSVPICDTRGRSGPKVSKRREPGGNRQSEGTKAKPRKPNDFNGFRGSNPGGGYEIRTREAVTPTRFPSVRHRPLGESSITLFAAAFWPQQTTRREYHRLADKQNRRVLCVCRAWRLARPGSLRRSDARIQ